jgi:hypothetical protein
MFEARLGKEIVVDVHNDIGILQDVTRTLSDKGFDIYAINETVKDKICTVRMVTDDGLRVKDALRARRYNPREESVVMVKATHKPGMMRRINDVLASADVTIDHLYATSGPDETTSTIVFHTNHDERALVRLKETPWH